MNMNSLRLRAVLWAAEEHVLSKYMMTHLEIKGRISTLLSSYRVCVCVCVCVDKAKCYKWCSQHTDFFV